jgi:hypothetical protein
MEVKERVMVCFNNVRIGRAIDYGRCLVVVVVVVVGIGRHELGDDKKKKCLMSATVMQRQLENLRTL